MVSSLGPFLSVDGDESKYHDLGQTFSVLDQPDMIYGILGPPLGNVPVCVAVDVGVEGEVLFALDQYDGHYFLHLV